MPLTHRQELMLHLAGTVRLPSPPPATGTVTLLTPPEGKIDPNALVLRVTHQISGRLVLERLVRLADVRVVIACCPRGGGDGPRPFLAEELRSMAVEQARGQGDQEPVWLTGASVYVTESAPVVLNVEAALTASESTEYYPPLVGDGSTATARELGSVLNRHGSGFRGGFACPDGDAGRRYSMGTNACPEFEHLGGYEATAACPDGLEPEPEPSAPQGPTTKRRRPAAGIAPFSSPISACPDFHEEP